MASLRVLDWAATSKYHKQVKKDKCFSVVIKVAQPGTRNIISFINDKCEELKKKKIKTYLNKNQILVSSDDLKTSIYNSIIRTNREF